MVKKQMERVGFVTTEGLDSTIEQILQRGCCEVAAWFPDDGESDSNFEGQRVELERLTDLPLIVLSTSIGRCRHLARRLGDVITGRHVLVHTIRGVEEGTLHTASRIFHEETPTRRIGFVTGPMRLQDLRDSRPAAAVCASEFPEVNGLVEEAMMSPKFRVYHSRDLFGAELAAIYARLVAVMTGVVRGLQLGPSLEATLFSRGLAEMTRFITALDGVEATASGLAGVGNLYVNTVHDGDVDFQIGQHLSEVDSDRVAAIEDCFGAAADEIMAAASSFGDAARRTGADTYLLDAIRSVLEANRPIEGVIADLMELPALQE